ncbi:glycosyltransferase family 4 protein [Thauera phenolivorans]|uniref:glycosyltransferase family 4 protein n=1 Tax=Thauera phenolivorans TaxID=1792543 RepID=UPI00083AAF61|nr:glycosyltransferase family 4 protein [Thauera phenolivorans]
MHILNSVYGDSTGGRWNATLKTAELLAQCGHRVTLLLAAEDAAKVPDYAGSKIDVVTLRNSGHYDVLASWKARRLICERHIEAIIAHSGRAIHMLGRAAPKGVPVIAFNHSHNIKRTLRADAFFCITPYMKRLVDEATGGTKPSFVISNAVSVPPEDALKEHTDPPFTIGAIGRLVPVKGFHHLLAALGLLAKEGLEFRALIAGKGEQRAALERQAEELGLRDRVEFPGWIGPEQKGDFFNGLDVVCFTSEAEAQGITILESFAWRKALIGTDVDGASSCYVDGQTALVVPAKNPAALVAALRRLHDEPELRRRLAESGRREAVRLYSDQAIARLLDESVRKLVVSARRVGRG